MIRRALLVVALVAALGTSAQAATADDLVLWVDADLTVYLKNNTGADISFDGYQIAAQTNDLDVAGWYSISDRVAAGEVIQLGNDLGFGALGFGELSPTPAQLAEANISGVGILKAGAKFSLGKPFTSCESADNASFFFKVGGIPSDFDNGIVLACPEPSAWLLATFAVFSLAAFRRRGLRTR